MPDAERAKAALPRAELVVCQDAYDPTETSALAHAVLPAAQWPEKQGTMTNSERRVTLVRRAIEAPGDALPDWEIFARLAAALGFAEHLRGARRPRSTTSTPHSPPGASANRPGSPRPPGARRQSAVAVPHPDHPGTRRLYAWALPTPTGRAQAAATPPGRLPEQPDANFPLVLTTGRIASQWHTMTRTGKSRG